MGHVEAAFLNPGVSDHSPVLIRCDTNHQRLLHPKPFKLYSNVVEHPEFGGIIKRIWQQHRLGHDDTWRKLKLVKEGLKDLNRYMTSYQQKLLQNKQRLEIIQHALASQPHDQILIEQERSCIRN